MRLDHRNFRNKICRECIKRNEDKYGSFSCDCEGISVEEDVKLAMKHQGLSEHEARWSWDPVYFFETIYGSKVRWYQKRVLYCSAKKLAGRQCRQTGKTLMFMFKILHQVITTDNTSVLIVAPTEKQINETWNKYIFEGCIYKNDVVKDAVKSSAKSPSYEIKFHNGSRITMSIANESCRGFTGSILYIDEAALVPREALDSIIMTTASAGSDATIYYTSTPKGRGNPFYTACKDSPDTNEFHVSIYEVDEMKGQVPFFRKLLAGSFIQEAEAEFPDVSGGPFNYTGIDLAKANYEYADCVREPGFLYFGGVDWNGPNIGTYYYIIGFNPSTDQIKAVACETVSSATWNSMVAKDTFIKLNRKWQPKHWMVDYGYSATIVEDLKIWSIQQEQAGMCQPGDPDSMIKHIIEPVQFGAWLEIEDPFSREIIKKTTRGFMVAQISRLFEPDDGKVSICFPKTDTELITSLENYKTLNITDKGTEQYGFDKKSGIEDHHIDAFNLALYGIIKHYSELFNRIVASSIIINARELLSPPIDSNDIDISYGQSIILLTDNSPMPIELDSHKLRKFEPDESDLLPIISRTFDRGMDMGFSNRASKMLSRRTNYVIHRDLPI